MKILKLFRIPPPGQDQLFEKVWSLLRLYRKLLEHLIIFVWNFRIFHYFNPETFLDFFCDEILKCWSNLCTRHIQRHKNLLLFNVFIWAKTIIIESTTTTTTTSATKTKECKCNLRNESKIFTNSQTSKHKNEEEFIYENKEFLRSTKVCYKFSLCKKKVCAFYNRFVISQRFGYKMSTFMKLLVCKWVNFLILSHNSESCA